jgi:hypothetical protein
MVQQVVNVGVQANDATGDLFRDAFTKINNNFANLFAGNFPAAQLTVGPPPSGVALTVNGLSGQSALTTSVGNVTIGSPTDGTVSAFNVNGSPNGISGVEAMTLVQNSPTSGSGGLLITSNPASPSNLVTSIAMKNLVNVSGTISAISIQGGTDLGNLAMIMTNANQTATFQGITGMPSGQVGLINTFAGSLGAFPLAFGTGNKINMLISGAGNTTVAPTVAPAAGGSVACGIQASSTASLGRNTTVCEYLRQHYLDCIDYAMTVTTKLIVPTADNANGTIDTTYYTADNSCLINGGGIFQRSIKGEHYQQLNRTESGILRF